MQLGEREFAEDPGDLAVRPFIRDNLVECVTEALAVLAVEVGVFYYHHLCRRVAENVVGGTNRPYERRVARA